MAKEISANVKVSIASSAQSQAQGNLVWTEDLATGGGIAGFQQTIGTTAEAIAFGTDITAPKLIYIQNLEPTTPTVGNYVEVAEDAAVAVWPQKILAGTALVLRPETTTLYAKANTAAVKIWVVAG